MAVMQAVLMFWSDMWVLIPRVDKVQEGFHHQALQWMAVMVPKLQLDGTWLYLPIGEVLITVGLDDIGVYIAHL